MGGKRGTRHHGNGRSDRFRNEKETMEENNQNNAQVEETAADNIEAAETGTPANENSEEQLTPEEKKDREIEELKAQLEKEKKEYLFLMAEFDNYRKRTLKDKSELIKNAAEGAFKGLLPVVDDMERALQHNEVSEDVHQELESVRQGMELIHKKLKKYMEQNGVKEMETTGNPFDADKSEAIAMVPAPAEDMKGKVLDTVEKGYTINDKVLRHAKVVVGQ